MIRVGRSAFAFAVAMLGCIAAAPGCNRILDIKEKEPIDAASDEPGLAMTLAVSTMHIVRGQSATVGVTLQRKGGFGGAVTVDATGMLPGGVTWDPLTLDPSESTGTLTFHATSSAAFGSAAIQVLGVSAVVPVVTQSLQLIVQDASGSPDLTFGALAGTPGRVLVALGTGAQGVGPGGLKLAPETGACGAPIVLCGHARTVQTDSSIAVARLCADGTLDSTFGEGGVALANSAGSSADACNTMFLRAGGGINLAGFGTPSTQPMPPTPGTRDILVGRFVPAGIPDQNTGAGGFVTTPIGSADSIASGLVAGDNVLPGPAGVGSYIAGGGGAGGAVLVAFQKAGGLYTGFGVNGVATLGPPGTSALWLDRQSTGNVIVAVASTTPGVGATTFRVARLTPVGMLDTTFGVRGVSNVGDAGSSAAVVLVAQQPPDAVYAVGTTPGAGGSRDIAVVRLSASGGVDTSYGSAGWATAHLGDGVTSSASSAALQDDGAVVVAGQTQTEQGEMLFSVVRFSAAGALDPSFGDVSAGGGRATFGVGAAQAIIVDDLGRIVVAGVVGASDMPDGVVVYRLWP